MPCLKCYTGGIRWSLISVLLKGYQRTTLQAHPFIPCESKHTQFNGRHTCCLKADCESLSQSVTYRCSFLQWNGLLFFDCIHGFRCLHYVEQALPQSPIENRVWTDLHYEHNRCVCTQLIVCYVLWCCCTSYCITYTYIYVCAHMHRWKNFCLHIVSNCVVGVGYWDLCICCCHWYM